MRKKFSTDSEVAISSIENAEAAGRAEPEEQAGQRVPAGDREHDDDDERDHRLRNRRDQRRAGPCSGVAEDARQDALAAKRERVAGHRVVVAHHAGEDAREQQDVTRVDDRVAVAEERLSYVEDQVRALLLCLRYRVAGADRDRDRPAGHRVHDAHHGDRQVRRGGHGATRMTRFLGEHRGGLEADECRDSDRKRRADAGDEQVVRLECREADVAIERVADVGYVENDDQHELDEEQQAKNLAVDVDAQGAHQPTIAHAIRAYQDHLGPSAASSGRSPAR